MAHRMLRDPDADGWERADFPILCETCLGPNPYVRMTKEQFGRECKICTRPFTIFRWRPGHDARYKKTEVCQTCSKMKNVCQVCLLDLEYGLPVQVRDQALGVEGQQQLAKSDVNREYQAELLDKQAAEGIDFNANGGLGGAGGKAGRNDTLLKLQRTTPYYKRNRAHICSFFARGECTRGAECPYRHEMPNTGPLAEQNLKDRYYGVNDPVAEKLLAKAKDMPSLAPPEDETISTLYIGGLQDTIDQKDLEDTFYAYGELASVRLIKDRKCAFVTYTDRHGAEKAAGALHNKLMIKGVRCKLMWGKPARPMAGLPPAGGEAGPSGQNPPGPSGMGGPMGFFPPGMMMPPQMMMGAGMMGMPPPQQNFFNLPPQQMYGGFGMHPGGPPQGGGRGAGMGMAPPPARAAYPSMDPNAMGSMQRGGGGGGGQ